MIASTFSVLASSGLAESALDLERPILAEDGRDLDRPRRDFLFAEPLSFLSVEKRLALRGRILEVSWVVERERCSTPCFEDSGDDEPASATKATPKIIKWVLIKYLRME